MSTVMTVTGPVSESELGRVLIHEHVFLALPGYELDFLDPLDEDDIVARAVAKLRDVREEGVRTIVDAGPMPWYRRPDLLQRISEEAEVYIVASTGLYTEGSLGTRSHFRPKSAAELSELFCAEASTGLGGSSIHPGIIKFAGSGEDITEFEQRILEAVVQTQKETGLGIITHSEGPLGGIGQAQAFLDAGADMGRVLIGHLDNSTDVDYFKRVAKSGAWLGFDRIGFFPLVPHVERHAAILGAFQAGLGPKCMLSHDFVGTFKGSHFFAEDDPVWAPRARLGYRFLFRELIPYLLANGVSEELVDQVLSDNPRRLLAGSAT